MGSITFSKVKKVPTHFILVLGNENFSCNEKNSMRFKKKKKKSVYSQTQTRATVPTLRCNHPSAKLVAIGTVKILVIILLEGGNYGKRDVMDLPSLLTNL